jgi:hypothetical protein
MADLDKEVKYYIVQALACYERPSQVAEDVNNEFSVKIERQNVMRYDPTKQSGKNLSKELKDIFHATRDAFLAETVQIPIASKVFRLRSLQRMHDFYVSRKNFVQAQSILEQVAKEMGGFYTGKVQGDNSNTNPLLVWLQQIGGTSIPIAQDIDGESTVMEGELVAEPTPEPKAAKPSKPKKLVVERD